MARCAHVVNHLPHATLIPGNNFCVQQLVKCHAARREVTCCHLFQEPLGLAGASATKECLQHCVVRHHVSCARACHVLEMLQRTREVVTLNVSVKQAIVGLRAEGCATCPACQRQLSRHSGLWHV